MVPQLDEEKVEDEEITDDDDDDNDDGNDTDELIFFPVGHIQARDDVSIHSDGTDELLNSTASFSEHAWDNYQDPPYPSVSEDPTEEKLDDSHLQWDHTSLEFEDDFDLNSNRPGRKSPDKSRNRDRKSVSMIRL